MDDKTQMKFICTQHGEVKPNRIGYSIPAIGWCPKCGEMMEDRLGGISIKNKTMPKS